MSSPRQFWFSLLQWFGLSLFLFGLGLNLIYLTILSPPLMNSSVAVWTHWTPGTHINTLWVCLLKAGCQIVLWTKGTEFRGMRLGSAILILSLFLVDADTLIARGIACANRYRRRSLGLFAASLRVIVSSLPLFRYRQSILLLEIYFRLSAPRWNPWKRIMSVITQNKTVPSFSLLCIRSKNTQCNSTWRGV